MHKRMRLQDHLEELVSPASDSSVVISSPLNSARDFEFLEQGHFVLLRTWWGSFKTWSQHINYLIIEMCWVSHNLWRQITIFHKGWVNPGSLGHRCRVTHLSALTGLTPVRPVPVTGQTGDLQFTPFWWFSFPFPWMCECITNLIPATWIRHCSTREPLKASNGMRE
jgi:hypothetical protein